MMISDELYGQLRKDHFIFAGPCALESFELAPVSYTHLNATDAATIHPAPENPKTIRRGAPFHQPSGWSLH